MEIDEEKKIPNERIYEKPAQVTAKEKIHAINSHLSTLRGMQSSGLSNVSHKEIKDLQKQKSLAETQLRKLKQNAKRQKKKRQKAKEKIQKACEVSEEVRNILKPVNRNTIGRPRLETDQPQLLKTILDLVNASSSADARRRTEKLTTLTSLDDLTEALKSLDFDISRTATYYRLLPKRGGTSAALRHVKTVPVRLMR